MVEGSVGTIFRIRDLDEERVKGRARELVGTMRSISAMIREGDCLKALMAMRPLFSHLTIAEAEALGVLDLVVEVIGEYKERCLRR